MRELPAKLTRRYLRTEVDEPYAARDAVRAAIDGIEAQIDSPRKPPEEQNLVP